VTPARQRVGTECGRPERPLRPRRCP
jgi:hypothetical protein